eukprot:gene10550-3069_t
MGKLYGFGANFKGEMGTGSTTPSYYSSPTLVAGSMGENLILLVLEKLSKMIQFVLDLEFVSIRMYVNVIIPILEPNVVH